MLNFSNGGAGANQSDSIGFYNRLRDDTAGRLIKRYGRKATLRKDAGSYDPSTGTHTESFTDTTVYVVILPKRGPNSGMTQGYSDDSIVKSDFGLLMSVKETFAASVVPLVNDIVLINSQRLRVDVISSISTGGTDVMYKMGVSNA
jgi:hypothetical protein